MPALWAHNEKRFESAWPVPGGMGSRFKPFFQPLAPCLKQSSSGRIADRALASVAGLKDLKRVKGPGPEPR